MTRPAAVVAKYEYGFFSFYTIAFGKLLEQN